MSGAARRRGRARATTGSLANEQDLATLIGTVPISYAPLPSEPIPEPLEEDRPRLAARDPHDSHNRTKTVRAPTSRAKVEELSDLYGPDEEEKERYQHLLGELKRKRRKEQILVIEQELVGKMPE